MGPTALSEMQSAFAEAKSALSSYVTERKNQVSRS
jgi:hypothetical protein